MLVSEQSSAPLSLELGQAAIAVGLDGEEVVDVIDHTVLGILPAPVIDHTKNHTTAQDPT